METNYPAVTLHVSSTRERELIFFHNITT